MTQAPEFVPPKPPIEPLKSADEVLLALLGAIVELRGRLHGQDQQLTPVLEAALAYFDRPAAQPAKPKGGAA